MTNPGQIKRTKYFSPMDFFTYPGRFFRYAVKQRKSN
jgi:hypothetical protein